MVAFVKHFSLEQHSSSYLPWFAIVGCIQKVSDLNEFIIYFPVASVVSFQGQRTVFEVRKCICSL